MQHMPAHEEAEAMSTGEHWVKTHWAIIGMLQRYLHFPDLLGEIRRGDPRSEVAGLGSSCGWHLIYNITTFYISVFCLKKIYFT
jgi:hypothetical protein